MKLVGVPGLTTVTLFALARGRGLKHDGVTSSDGFLGSPSRGGVD